VNRALGPGETGGQVINYQTGDQMRGEWSPKTGGQMRRYRKKNAVLIFYLAFLNFIIGYSYCYFIIIDGVHVHQIEKRKRQARLRRLYLSFRELKLIFFFFASVEFFT
jgi:hypothetical protein